MKTAVAVDLGASGGRLIAGYYDGKAIQTTEIYRFSNGTVSRNGHLFWDTEMLLSEIWKGLSKISRFDSVGIDTWGVDYALLDEQGELLSDIYSYRDHRTAGLPETVDKDAVYNRTGIQIAAFNTLFQLMAHSPKHAAHFMTLPDYLHYRLGGRIACEYTNATTTQLINIQTGDWDEEMIAMTGFPRSMFPEIIQPGTVLGNLRGNTNVKVIAPATHDTASAIASIPSGDNFAYISSGTWSLMGVRRKTPHMDSRFTNEGCAFGNFGIHKNIMGLWIIQEVRRMLADSYTYNELEEMAQEPFGSVVDINESRFLSPENMITELQDACRTSEQKVPSAPGELARCVFDSLAHSYAVTLSELREFATIDRIQIIGGGSKNLLLNRLCEEAAQCKVETGVVEATALGNLYVQLNALGELPS